MEQECIHLFKNYILSNYYVPNSVICSGYSSVKETGLHSAYILVEAYINKVITQLYISLQIVLSAPRKRYRVFQKV